MESDHVFNVQPIDTATYVLTNEILGRKGTYYMYSIRKYVIMSNNRLNLSFQDSEKFLLLNSHTVPHRHVSYYYPVQVNPVKSYIVNTKVLPVPVTANFPSSNNVAPSSNKEMSTRTRMRRNVHELPVVQQWQTCLHFWITEYYLYSTYTITL